MSSDCMIEKRRCLRRRSSSSNSLITLRVRTRACVNEHCVKKAYVPLFVAYQEKLMRLAGMKEEKPVHNGQCSVLSSKCHFITLTTNRPELCVFCRQIVVLLSLIRSQHVSFKKPSPFFYIF